MKTRCTNPNFKDARYYSELDIGYDPAWKDFNVFLADMGEAPSGHQLDRRDTLQGYSKDNCRWVTSAVNNRNKTNSVLTEEKVRWMKAIFRSVRPGTKNSTVKKLVAETFGVSLAVVQSVQSGRNWADVE